MCIGENILVRLLAGELSQEQRQAVVAHLAQCAACRQLHDSLQQVWDGLEPWEVRPPQRDLVAGVLAAARKESLRSRWYVRGRIAAAILLAGGIGWSAGRLSSGPGPAGPPVSTEEMARMVGLDALGGDVGALSAVFPDDSEAQSPSTAGGRS